MGDVPGLKSRIQLWDLDKLKSCLQKLEDIYYNYDGVVSLKLIFIIRQEIAERVGDYEETQELYGGDASGGARST